jgi:hypothetical protein
MEGAEGGAMEGFAGGAMEGFTGGAMAGTAAGEAGRDVGAVSPDAGPPGISLLSTSFTMLLTSPITNYDACAVPDVA